MAKVEFKELPASITSLDLRQNNLSKKNGAELAELFQSLPPNLLSLKLRSNNLYEYVNPAAELGKAFNALPASLRSLDLGDNGLAIKTAEQLIALVRAIPSRVIELNLGSNVSLKNDTELASIYKALPVGLTSLGLSLNSLGRKSIETIKALPAGLTSLAMSWNALYASSQLDNLFAAFPIGLTTLNLSNNSLSGKSSDDLAQAFAAIPVGMTSLDLSNNDFDKMSTKQLVQIFASLPEIPYLTLSEKDIATRSPADLIALGKALSHVIDIKIIAEGYPSYNSTHKSTNDLRKHIGGSIKEAHQLLADEHGLVNDLPSIIIAKSTGIDKQVIDVFIKNHNEYQATQLQIEQERQAAELKMEQDRQAIEQERQAKEILQMEQEFLAKESALHVIISQLEIIQDKADKLKTRGHKNASEVVEMLYNTLNLLKEDYISGRNNYAVFKDKSIAEIDRVRTHSELKQHRGTLGILDKIIAFILGCLPTSVSTNSVFKIKTNSEEMLDNVQNKIDAVSLHLHRH